jgi:hypothetical protein
MNYCSSCRRHLNGVLVCPGCGAYAPDIVPPSEAAAGKPMASDTWHDGPLRDEAELAAETNAAPDVDPAADVEGVPARPGRAARRRQLARWKKQQRRAVVATAVALVGGGLTIATMDRHSTDRAQAATAPDDRSMSSTQEQTAERTHPASTPPRTHRSSHRTTPKAQPAATNTPRQQSIAATPRTAPPIARPDAALSPRRVATSSPKPQTAAQSPGDTSSNRTGTAAEPTPATTAGGAASSTSGTSPAPATTSPAELCLLVVCLG